MPANAEPDEGLAAAIKRLREERDISQEDLAADADLGVRNLRQIELGKADPMWGTVRRLAKALGVEMNAILALAEELRSG